MKKYKYKVVNYYPSYYQPEQEFVSREDFINSFAAQGWRLVTVEGGTLTTCYFEREVIEP